MRSRLLWRLTLVATLAAWGLAWSPPIAAQADGSTRGAPLPLGATGQVLSFQIEVVDVVPDAMDMLAAENLTYPPPMAGNQYYLVRIGVTYVGAASNNPNLQLDFKAVGASNVGYTVVNQSCGPFPEHPFYVGDLATGESAEFNVCWQVAASDVESLVMYVEATWAFGVAPAWFSLGNDPGPPPSHGLVAPATPAATPVTGSDRERAVPVGTTSQVGDYLVTVTRVIPQADAYVAEASPFAAPPTDGNQFTLATVAIAYVGPDVGDPYVQLGYYAVPASGAEYGHVTSGCGDLPNGLDTARDLFPGGTLTYDICWQVPIAEAAELALRVDPASTATGAVPAWFALAEG